MRPPFRTMILVSLLAVTVPAHADDKAIRKTLTANYAKFDQAFKKNDFAAFANMLAPDYAAIQPNGQKIGAAEMVTNFQREHKSLKNPQLESKITSFTVKGDQATTTVHGRLTGTMDDPRNKESHKLVVVADSKDTWIKKDGVWKLKLFQVIHQTVTLDGKPVGGAGETKGGKVGKVGNVGTPGK